MSQSNMDILVFAPHPDDAEILCGGILAKMADQGYSTAIIDLTQGELGTNGDVALRQKESAKAAEVLKISHRENLSLPDGGINAFETDTSPNSQLGKVVEVIRRLKPVVILAPPKDARHPDHTATHELVTKGVFFAGLERFNKQASQKKFVPKQLIYYMMRYEFNPSFIVDISEYAEIKMNAIKCYDSQVNLIGRKETLVNNEKSLHVIDTRDRYYGAMIGHDHAEPFLINNVLELKDPIGFFKDSNADKTLIFPKR